MTRTAHALIPAYSHVDDRLQAALDGAEVPWTPFHRCSDLPKARSQLITFGLEHTQAEVFLLVDSDIVPTVEQVKRLLESPKLTEWAAVSGAYALGDGRTAFVPRDLDTTVHLGEPGYTDLSAAGLGFVAIHRHSLEAITRQLPRITSTASGWWPFCVPLFRSTGVGTAEYLPDDYVLWMRHAAEGGLLWLDNELLVAHNTAQPRRPVPGPVTRG